MKARCLMVGVIALLIAGALASSTYAKIDLEACVGMWLFDEGSGNVAKDSSGNKNDGKLVENPKWYIRSKWTKNNAKKKSFVGVSVAVY